MAWFRRNRSSRNLRESDTARYRDALRALLRDDFEQAEGALAEVVGRDSGDREAYLVLGDLYRRRGEVGRAIRVHQNLLLREGLSREERVEILLELGRDFETGGFAERARTSYEEALELAPGHEQAADLLRALLVAEGHYEEVLQLQGRLRRFPGKSLPLEVATLRSLAQAAHQAGDESLARKLLKRCLRQTPDDVGALCLLGDMEAERKKSRAALKAWRRAIEVGGPGSERAYALAEAASVAAGKSQRQEEFLRGVVETRPEDTLPRLALAHSLWRRGEADPAIQVLREILDREPGCVDARVLLGQVCLAEKRDMDALKAYAELLHVLGEGRSGGLEGAEE